MQIIRLFFLVLLAITANASWAQVAQSKGAFTLQEAVTIATAIEAFAPAKEPSVEEVPAQAKKAK